MCGITGLAFGVASSSAFSVDVDDFSQEEIDAVADHNHCYKHFIGDFIYHTTTDDENLTEENSIECAVVTAIGNTGDKDDTDQNIAMFIGLQTLMQQDQAKEQSQ